MLEGLFDCILKKYSSIGSKKYYILLLWTRGALGGVLLELLANGSTTTLQTTLINEMLSFYFSRFCLSQSQGSRREREFCSLNLRVQDEKEIFVL